MKYTVSARIGALRLTVSSLLLCLLAGGAGAQVATVPVAGIADRTPRTIALTHARLVVRPGTVVEDGTLLVRDGVIVAAGRKVSIPAGTAVTDLGGRSVFAGFVDAGSDYGQPPPPPVRTEAPGRVAAPAEAAAGAGHWNRRVKAEHRVADTFKPDGSRATALRGNGFTSVLSTPKQGIFRGQAALVTTADSGRPNEILVAADAAQQVAFEQARGSDDYPTSLMGAIALIRQTFLDAQWQQQRSAWQDKHRQAERIEANAALDALAAPLAGRQPVIFATEDELDYQRALALADEFKLRPILAGNGREYRMATALKAAGVPVIVPLKTNDAPVVEDPDQALDVSLSELEHWEWAPYNARVLAEAGVTFALTAGSLKKPDEFWPALRKAVEKGLDEDAALAALTTHPAKMLGLDDRIGTLEPGRRADFIVADADLFRSDKARVRETWVGGRRYEVAAGATDTRGTWSLAWTGTQGPAQLEITGETGDPVIKAGATTIPATVAKDQMLLYPPGSLLGRSEERVTVVATIDGDRLQGRAPLPGGGEAVVTGHRTQASPRAADAAKPRPTLPAPALRYPAGEFGRAGLPAQPRAVIVRGATIWTQGPQGRLEQADLLVEKGRIAAVGQGLKAPADAVEIDGRGKHVSPGIIDAHSHIAIARGVNEGSHAVTSEVRIGDVLDPTDITIYRQLGGGVTSAQLLHGSANPIGGQSQVIKLRWGSDAAGLRFAGVTPTIKFALGENVKQSNWGSEFTSRYPQTRMGVPEIMLDQFLAARGYAARLREKGGAPVRRDLRLEALAQVLAGERIVHIHSYRQDEILAFARIAQRLKFVPVFQHILEGYKVADVLADLGAGASTFSDWWAYKMEVVDAIPYNGALMAAQDVVVSFNSDDGEMARRLNTEAAKAIKYGGLAETAALDLVTRNPARQLRIDGRVGSLEAGKDADFVIWSDSPLSTLAYAEQTWIDGRRYFDRAEDRAEQARIEAERTRLIAAVLPERVKALAKKGDKVPKKDAAGEPAPVPPDNEIDIHALDRIRPIYHDGESIHLCSGLEAH